MFVLQIRAKIKASVHSQRHGENIYVIAMELDSMEDDVTRVSCVAIGVLMLNQGGFLARGVLCRFFCPDDIYESVSL